MYQLNYDTMTGKVSNIKRLSDSASIPLCEDNTDFQAFLEWNAEQAVPLDIVSINQAMKDAYEAAKAAREAARAAKAQAFLDNLPSWAAVETAVDNIANLVDAKDFIKKLARVLYWLACDRQD